MYCIQYILYVLYTVHTVCTVYSIYSMYCIQYIRYVLYTVYTVYTYVAVAHLTVTDSVAMVTSVCSNSFTYCRPALSLASTVLQFCNFRVQYVHRCRCWDRVHMDVNIQRTLMSHIYSIYVRGYTVSLRMQCAWL